MLKTVPATTIKGETFPIRDVKSFLPITQPALINFS